MSKLYDLLSAMCGKIKKPDWNQNDETVADYIKNRPFYSETESVSETREFTDSLTDVDFVDLLVTNKEIAQYTIGGVSYVFFEDMVPPMGYCWSLAADDGTIAYIMIDSGVITMSGEVSISISTEVETVHKIDSKFIEDDVAGEIIWLTPVESGSVTLYFGKSTSYGAKLTIADCAEISNKMRTDCARVYVDYYGIAVCPVLFVSIHGLISYIVEGTIKTINFAK